MKRPPFIATTLAVIYFLLALNAYACLIPLYGGMQVAQGSDCTMPQEQPARQHCDAFKSIGVQTLSLVQPLPDSLSHVVAGDQLAVTILNPTVSLHHDLSVGQPLLGRDTLTLISILRI
jgi:hypothetical protein